MEPHASFRLLAVAALADGEVSGEEKGMLLSYARELELSPDEATEILKETARTGKAAWTPPESDEEKERLFAAVLEVVLSDDDVDPAEDGLLLRLRKAFGYSQADVDRILDGPVAAPEPAAPDRSSSGSDAPGLVSILLGTIVVVAVVVGLVLHEQSKGEVVRRPGIQVRYKGGITEAQATKVADIFKPAVTLPNQEYEMVLERYEDTILVRFIARKEALRDERIQQELRVLAAGLSREVFGGRETRIQLCDEDFRVKKTLKAHTGQERKRPGEDVPR